MDFCRNLILSTCFNYFNKTAAAAGAYNEQADGRAIEEFISEPECRTLWCFPLGGNKDKLQWSRDIGAGGDEKSLVFFKLRDARVSQDNFYDLVQLTSIAVGSRNHFAEALRRVWAPALAAGSDGQDLRALLKKLENQLVAQSRSEAGFEPHRASSKLIELEETRLLDKAAGLQQQSKRNLESAALYLKSIRRDIDQAAVARYFFSFFFLLSLTTKSSLTFDLCLLNCQ